MFGDSADRPSVAPISSATEASSELKIERIAGSAANVRPLHELPLYNGRNCGRRIGGCVEGEDRRPRARTVGARQPDAGVAVLAPSGLPRPLPERLLANLEAADRLPGDQV